MNFKLPTHWLDRWFPILCIVASAIIMYNAGWRRWDIGDKGSAAFIWILAGPVCIVIGVLVDTDRRRRNQINND